MDFIGLSRYVLGVYNSNTKVMKMYDTEIVTLQPKVLGTLNLMLPCLKAELAEKSNFLALRGREVLTKTKKRMELTHNYEIMDILWKIISHYFYFTESFC